jgi:hypothetical protein
VTGESSDRAAEGWTGGEPDAVYHRRSALEGFEQIDRDLNDIDVLRIADHAWMTDDSLAPHLRRVITHFRARGGRVEMAVPTQA